jgi:hypothetical protein
MLTLSSLSSNLFILLLGFLFGNLFPTFFGEFLGKIFTPLFLLIALDSFNYFYYSKNIENRKTQLANETLKDFGSKSFSSWIHSNPRSPQQLFKKSSKSLQNSLKIGFLFGLFVDAFKVGS